MTRLAVLADIHGNLPALEAVITDLAGQTVDLVVVAGDTISWGPFSAAVARRVMDLGWVIIRGNHEFYLLDYGTPRAPAAWADQALYPGVTWLQGQHDRRQRLRIAAWPDTLRLCLPETPPIRVVHGSPRHNREGLYPTDDDAILAERLALVEEETVIAAHTHLALERRPGRWHLLNPGSVGLPFDGDRRASYLILDGDHHGWQATFRRVAFDTAAVVAEFGRRRFAEQCGAIGQLIVEEHQMARLRVLPFIRWRAGCCPTAPISTALLDEFARVDPWAYTPPAYHLNRDLES